jgi:hypothetical protein
MASMTSVSLQSAISNYEQAKGAFYQEKKKYDIASSAALFGLKQAAQNASTGPEDPSVLANVGFFYASRTFNKVFTKNVEVEKIKNLTLISTLFSTMPDLAQKIFPGIQLTSFQSKEGLEALRTQLTSREDYQAFQKKEWAEYENLKASNKLSKQNLVSLINSNGILRTQMSKHTKDKRIIRLGKKEAHE